MSYTNNVTSKLQGYKAVAFNLGHSQRTLKKNAEAWYSFLAILKYRILGIPSLKSLSGDFNVQPILKTTNVGQCYPDLSVNPNHLEILLRFPLRELMEA